MGYHRAGFEVVGVDIQPQPHYPFEFIQADAVAVMELLSQCGRYSGSPFLFDVELSAGLNRALFHVDAVHASPPCQRYSDLANRNGNASDWPDLVPVIRERLIATGNPYVIENVEGAPLRNPIMLCGTMFPGLRVLRHRLFESNIPLTAPAHPQHPLVFTHDKRKAHYGKLDQSTAFVQVTGGGNATLANKRDAMGIDWMNGREVNEAIPPAYTEFIGRQLLSVVQA